jgi:antitoxin component YwqK of YwqJK toxin-antitoxin module
MKFLLPIVFFCFSFFLQAQSRLSADAFSTRYEKEGDLVKVTKYHDTGAVREQGYYDRNNRLTGTWVVFDKKGKKTTIAQYYKGNKVGKWFVWKNERLLELDFENAKLAMVNEWKNQSTLADN